MYAYKIENGQVVDGIVVDGENTSAQWASETLGGVWVDSPTLAWIGGTWDEVNGFLPSSPYPSWVWTGTSWEAPVPAPDFPAVWDEDARAWVAVDPDPPVDMEP